ncbi:MAG: anthranilate synthase component II, partial [Olsenella sp.]
MILLIDNYDSFSYNLYQLIGSVEPDILVIRNDAATVDEVASMGAEAIVLSPGPGRPSEAGICEDVVRQLSGIVPILGVCLGHQAICEALGGTIIHAQKLMH